MNFYRINVVVHAFITVYCVSANGQKQFIKYELQLLGENKWFKTAGLLHDIGKIERIPK